MEPDDLAMVKLENTQLKTELTAQQAVYQKLKVERDHFFGCLEDAEEEIR